MQVNPIGIRSYQQPTRQEDTAAVNTNTNRNAQETQTRVTIPPQEQISGSRLALKVPRGSYADYLTPEENKALDLLFGRFKDLQRFGPAYKAEGSSESDNVILGNQIDLKA